MLIHRAESTDIGCYFVVTSLAPLECGFKQSGKNATLLLFPINVAH
jgi:hypothetical protein